MKLLASVTACFLLSFLYSGQCLALNVLSRGLHRRSVISLASGAFVGLAHHEAASAASPANPSEAIRRSAANIPGYGQSDVFYPSFFQGNWRVKRTILLPENDGLTLDYSVRFLPSIEDGAVVADRGWNQANLEMAIRALTTKTPDDAAMPSYQWTETNPNDLRLTFPDGTQKEIKVTKRATEKTEEGVFSSEFQRVTQEDFRGIPVISARRVMSKYKVVGSSIEGMEVVYDAGGIGDPLAGPTNAGNAGDSSQPKILTKSKLLLERTQ
ncbi:expressed unknown protein [Seminavis robusta]|uniref:DUF6816 domain-containing protein n=1 Tax=Seminavis robusta TaxID=568900 RepID=A0A9N8EK87_9STRA|nr:expressed unknown protein [Seminavis robusta]|eukprot:Sro1136_g245120.1 n/a (269) ;mRNA; f:4832-5638